LYNYPKKLDVYNWIRNINKGTNREDRIPYNAFRSPSPMNELCDYVNQWEKRKIDWDRSLINNGHLLIDNSLDLSDKQIIKKIKHIYNEFDAKLREVLDEESSLEPIIEEFSIKLNNLITNKELLANYCIKTAYQTISSDKILCWSLFGDTILKNLRNNSDERKECEIVEVTPNDGQEFLGKYYKLIKIHGE
jgi:hypothetical protein